MMRPDTLACPVCWSTLGLCGHRMFLGVLLLTGWLNAAEYRRDPAAGEKIATAAEIIAECQADLVFNGADDHPRWVSIPETFTPDAAAAGVSFVVNSTISRTSNVIRCELVGEYLVRVDLGKFAVRDEDLREILSLWELLADKDTFFRTPRQTLVKLSDGTWKPCRIVSRGKDRCEIEFGGKRLAVLPADVKHGSAFFAAGLEDLQAATGSQVPVIRYDDFVAATFSTVNGGLYYRLLGIREGVDTVPGVIERFAGKDAASKFRTDLNGIRQGRFDPSQSTKRALVIFSNVAQQRIGIMFHGAAGDPENGEQVIFYTLDIDEDNPDPDADPTRNIEDYKKYAGGEGQFTLPNGLMGYIVGNQKDVIIASVPDNVAADTAAFKVRPVHTCRVFAGLSCANCHDSAEKNMGWQPIQNDAIGLHRLFNPTGGKDDMRNQRLQRIISAFRLKDVDKLLNSSRLSYQAKTHEATGVRTSREVVGGLADAYWGRIADKVTPRVAMLDLGHSLSEDDAQAALLMIPPGVHEDEITEDVVVARLKDGLPVTATQWRSVRRLVAERAEGLE